MRFDWDDGNREKCGKHGLSIEEIEAVLNGEPAILINPFPRESRFRAIGITPQGRHAYIVFTFPPKGRRAADKAGQCPLYA